MWFNKEMKHYCLRSINSFIPFGIRKNCLISGRSCYCTNLEKGNKLTIVIIMGYHCYQLHRNIFQYSTLLSPKSFIYMFKSWSTGWTRFTFLLFLTSVMSNDSQDDCKIFLFFFFFLMKRDFHQARLSLLRVCPFMLKKGHICTLLKIQDIPEEFICRPCVVKKFLFAFIFNKFQPLH
jgi:hypothetical protein